MHQPPITQWEVMRDRLKEKHMPSFYRAHLVNQMLKLGQSTSSVSKYINSFNFVEDPSITIARFIRGLKIDLKREVSLFAPYTLDQAYHKALKIEKLNKLCPVQCTLSSTPPRSNLLIR